MALFIAERFLEEISEFFKIYPDVWQRDRNFEALVASLQCVIDTPEEITLDMVRAIHESFISQLHRHTRVVHLDRYRAGASGQISLETIATSFDELLDELKDDRTIEEGLESCQSAADMVILGDLSVNAIRFQYLFKVQKIIVAAAAEYQRYEEGPENLIDGRVIVERFGEYAFYELLADNDAEINASAASLGEEVVDLIMAMRRNIRDGYGQGAVASHERVSEAARVLVNPSMILEEN